MTEPTPRRSARLAALLLGWGLLTLAAWGAGALTITATRSLDLHGVRDLASDRTTLLSDVAHVLSFIGSGYVIIPLAVVITIGLYARARKPDAFAVALSVAGAMALSSLVKVIVDRARPPVHHLEAVSSASFPSGHATQSTGFFLAMLLAWLAARPGRPGRSAAIAATVVLIGAIGLSRVYLGVHYPTDVLAGIVLGGVWAVFTRRMLCASTEAADR